MDKYTTFYSEAEQADIVQAIQRAESMTSGEIRVHLEDHCDHHAKDRAAYIFEKLDMQATKDRNGVLFYFSVCDKNFAVIGDEGIHAQVGEGYWTELCAEIEQEFKEGAYRDGLVKAIDKVGSALVAYFPVQKDDQNELSDEISMGQI